MREDMFEVIIERPRAGSGYQKNHRRGECSERMLDKLSQHESMRYRFNGYGRKLLNENLAPLVRFLHSRVGKHWDAVYSEISKHASKSSAVQLHVFQHLQHMVRKDVDVIDGKPYIMNQHYVYTGGRYSGFFVCMKSGILRYSKHRH